MKYRIILCIITIVNTFKMFSQSTSVDSTAVVRDTVSTKLNIGELVFSGIVHQNYSDGKTWYVPSLFELFQFNVVEGVVFNPSISYTRTGNNGKFYKLIPNLRYSSGGKRVHAQVTAFVFYNPAKFGSFEISIGDFVKQINEKSALTALGNTFSTLISKENYLHIFGKTFIEAKHIALFKKNFLFSHTLEWADRRSFENLDRYSTVNSNFRPNAPKNSELVSTNFNSHQIFSWKVELKWQFEQLYRRYRGGFVNESEKAAITATFHKSFAKVFGSDISFQKISVGYRDKYSLRLIGRGEVLIETGNFVNSNPNIFLDFTHFEGNEILLSSFRLGNFQLLDYYFHSTADLYLKAHIEHKIMPFSIGRKDRTIKPIVTVNSLFNQTVSFAELGIGFSGIFKVMRLDLFSSIKDGKYEATAIRFRYYLEN